ncbi:hypothetical protein ScalyP_jg65, partial [Parmales sp. scaly parma]
MRQLRKWNDSSCWFLNPRAVHLQRKSVVDIRYNGGTTSLGHIIIRDGDGDSGEGLYVMYSNALLISGAGATSCTNCETGKYNEVPGAPTCTDCGEGKYLGST